MWIIYSSSILFIIGYVDAVGPSDDILVQCASCKNGKTGILEGILGEALVVRYIIKQEFAALKILYDNKNGTKNVISVSGVNQKVNTDQVKDRRFHLPEKITKINEGWGLNVTLNGLTMDDNGLKFVYEFLDVNAKQFEDSNSVTVYALPEFTSDIKFNVSYDVYEDQPKTISLSMKGNPRPNVTVKIGVTNFPVDVKDIKSYTYSYSVTVNLKKNRCGHKMSVTAVGFGDRDVTKETTMNVIFKPDPPSTIEAHINISKCLTVEWEKIESGDCPVVYTLKYNETILTNDTSEVKYHNCNGFNTSDSTTVAVKASVHGNTSEFSQPQNVTVDVLTTPKPPTVKTDKVIGGSGGDLPDWAIIVIAVGAFVVLLIIVLLVLICCGVIRCACCGEGKGKRNTRTKPTTEINGTTNPRFKHDNTEMKPIEGDYEYVSSRAKASKPESDYSDVNDFAAPKNPTPQQMDYAELGPGGRTGEKPAIKESNYAQVNPDAAYYPPLNPDNRQPPIYAVSSKPRKKRSPEPPCIDDGDSIVV